MTGKKRFLVVGPGRTGSSLLSAIISEAGADFGISDRNDWDRSSGAFEHPDLISATDWYSRARKIGDSLIPNSPLKPLFESLGKKKLQSALLDGDTLKSSRLVYVVQQIHELGFTPKIILSFRNFPEYCRSRYLRSNHSYSTLRETYLNVFRTALMQLKVFGGTIVSYKNLVSHNKNQWIRTVSKLTNLSKNRLAEARTKKVKEDRHQPLDLIIPTAVETLTERIQAHEGKVHPPSISLDS